MLLHVYYDLNIIQTLDNFSNKVSLCAYSVAVVLELVDNNAALFYCRDTDVSIDSNSTNSI